jgi:hypothetical protein
MEVVAEKIGGGNSVGITARGISTFSNVFIITMTKEEYSTSGLRVCGGTLIYFSRVLHSS